MEKRKKGVKEGRKRLGKALKRMMEHKRKS